MTGPRPLMVPAVPDPAGSVHAVLNQLGAGWYGHML